jgi:hypothetical protein
MRDLLIALRQSVAGKKSYAIVTIGLFLLLGSYAGWWKLPAELTNGLQLLALLFLRCAISRAKALTQPDSIPDPTPKPNPS